MAAAIRLQTMGFQTVCFEARDQPGGRAYVYRDNGFVFDAGPTVITAPHCLEELFALSNRALSDYVDLLPVSPFYRLRWTDGVQFDYVGAERDLLDQIRRINPCDVNGYRQFAAYAKKVFKKGYEELGAVPFLNFRDMVRVAPALLRLRADRSVYRTVSRFIQDEHLRQAFSFHPLLVGGDPTTTSSIYTLIHWIERQWGVFFPAGGTGALVRALAGLFQELGGDLRLDCPVRGVEVEFPGHSAGDPTQVIHRVTTDARQGEPFDLVVSNADLHHTYARLYRSTPAAVRTSRRLERMDWSMSLYVMYFGTKKKFPNLAHHTILFGPRFQGLLRDVFHGETLPPDFSLYLHAPTVTDPSLAPPGCEAFYVLSPVPHLGRAPIDWSEQSRRYGDTILASLEGYLPGLRESIVCRRDFTPVDFRDQLNAFHGSAFSVAPKLSQSAFFRPHNRDARIPGLYIVGAGTHPGAGVPGVVNTAKATCSVIAQDFCVANVGVDQ